MFGDRDRFEFQIKQLLEVFSLEEALEHLDITEYEVLRILFEGGHVDIPAWLEKEDAEANED